MLPILFWLQPFGLGDVAYLDSDNSLLGLGMPPMIMIPAFWAWECCLWFYLKPIGLGMLPMILSYALLAGKKCESMILIVRLLPEKVAYTILSWAYWLKNAPYDSDGSVTIVPYWLPKIPSSSQPWHSVIYLLRQDCASTCFLCHPCV